MRSDEFLISFFLIMIIYFHPVLLYNYNKHFKKNVFTIILFMAQIIYTRSHLCLTLKTNIALYKKLQRNINYIILIEIT